MELSPADSMKEQEGCLAYLNAIVKKSGPVVLGGM